MDKQSKLVLLTVTIILQTTSALAGSLIGLYIMVQIISALIPSLLTLYVVGVGCLLFSILLSIVNNAITGTQ